MNPAVQRQPSLNELQWSLIIDLLERKRTELAVELRHSRTHAFRDELRQRLDMVDDILRRISPQIQEGEPGAS